MNDLKKIREKAKVAPSTLVKKLEITQSEIYDIENNIVGNVLEGNKKLERKICKFFNIERYELFPTNLKDQAIKKIYVETSNTINRVIFLDTSICMENYHYQRNFLLYFDRICICRTVIDELDKHKASKNMLLSDKARRALRNIQLFDRSILREFGNEIGNKNDDKIFNAVENYASKNPKVNVFFLSADRYHQIQKTTYKNIFNITPNEFHNEIEKFDQHYNVEKTETFWRYIENNTASSIERMDLSDVDINGIYKNGYTPLCYAIVNKRNDIVKLLLKLDDININQTGSNPYGYGPLHCAVHMKNINLVTTLLKQENTYLHVLSKDDSVNNVTALMVAVSKGLEDITKLLLEYGSSVNQQNTNGQTALHIAAEKNHISIYKLLLPFSDETIIDTFYNTAEEYLNTID